MKAPIMDQLHTDHVNYSRLLNLLEKYLEEQKAGSDKGYLEMYLIMNYMMRYPDIFHHPYEDIIFDAVENLDTGVHDNIQKLLKEHQVIYAASKNLLDELDAVVNGHIIEKQKVWNAVVEYVDLMRKHMDLEESSVFPFINDRMTSEAWRTIQDKLKLVRDPLFGDKVESEYKLLYEQIMQE